MKQITCIHCRGKGTLPNMTQRPGPLTYISYTNTGLHCTRCGGFGQDFNKRLWMESYQRTCGFDNDPMPPFPYPRCPDCNGTGYQALVCPDCNGKGYQVIQ